MSRSTLAQLLSLDSVRTNAPAPESAIAEVCRQLAAPLPEAISQVWRATNGLALEPLDAHILGAEEALEVMVNDAWNQGLVQRGFLPIVDDHQSNYCAVVVKEPLAFRVTYLPHDDGARLLYKDVESCLSAIVDGMKSKERLDILLHETDGDFGPDTPRSREDQNVARALLASDGKLDEWNYAMQLLDSTNIPEFATLLESEHFVRRDVIARMQKMSSPAINRLLRDDEREFAEFAALAIAAAKAAGLKAGVLERGHVLQVNGKWIDLEAFYHRRKIPDAMRRMITWIQDLIAGRDPRKRPGHFNID